MKKAEMKFKFNIPMLTPPTFWFYHYPEELLKVKFSLYFSFKQNFVNIIIEFHDTFGLFFFLQASVNVSFTD